MEREIVFRIKRITQPSTRQGIIPIANDFDPDDEYTKIVPILPVCAFCKEKGHAINFCPKVTCRRCQNLGHTERVCGSSGICIFCNKEGHLVNSCPVLESLE